MSEGEIQNAGDRNRNDPNTLLFLAWWESEEGRRVREVIVGDIRRHAPATPDSAEPGDESAPAGQAVQP